MRRVLVLVDTGPLVALFSARDAYHEVCSRALTEINPPFLTTWPVITEAAWLLRDQPIGLQRLFEALAEGFCQVADLDAAAFPWLSGFLRRYRKLGPDVADGSLVYSAERQGLDTIFTLDRRHFSVYRFGRNQAFNLLPQSVGQ